MNCRQELEYRTTIFGILNGPFRQVIIANTFHLQIHKIHSLTKNNFGFSLCFNKDKILNTQLRVKTVFSKMFLISEIAG